MGKSRMLVRLALLSVLTVQMVPVSAEIFKCTNKAGKVFYNDKPCPSLDDEKKMRSEKDVVNGYVPLAINKEENELRKRSNQSSSEKLSSLRHAKANKKGKTEKSSIDSQSLKGSGGRKKGKYSANAGVGPEEKAKILSLKGRYADREKTIEDKRIYLGIRRQVE